MDESWLTSCLASDAADGSGVLPEWIRALRPGARVIGHASTCGLSPGDNLFMRRALEAGPVNGDVLVVGGAADSDAAIMGGLIAEALASTGIRAVVTDGLVRDSAEVAEHLKVWARGVIPRSPAKKGPGSVGEAVVVGGVTVKPGDLVIADEDGVVVWPATALATLRMRARDRDARDQARLSTLRRTGRLE